jgi:D-hydroxyproline dehydrogenase subunit alpha
MRKESAEVVVIGAGPAGLEAAVAAGEAASVLLIDDNPFPGGQIWRRDASLVGRQTRKEEKTRATVADLLDQMETQGDRRLAATRIYDAPAPGLLLAEEESESGAVPVEVSYERLILCTGARELFLPFPGWTLPGVYGVGALQAMVKSGLEVRGKRIGLAGTGPLLYAVARDLRRRGAEVAVIAEQAPALRVLGFGLGLWREPKRMWEGLLAYGQPDEVDLRHETLISSVEGENRVRRLITKTKGQRLNYEVDLVAASWGFVPETRLARHLGCAAVGGRGSANAVAVRVDDMQMTTVSGIYAAGEISGIGGAEKAAIEGTVAGLAATGREDEAATLQTARDRALAFADRLDRAFALDPALFGMAEDETLVCRCEDVPRAALRGHGDFRAAKIATRCGMGTCQGRICGPAAACLEGWALDGAEAPRPPLFPVSLGTLAEARTTSALDEESAT